MAYKFGQFRKEQYAYSNYVKPISGYTVKSIRSKAEGFQDIWFQDIAIEKNFTITDGSMFMRFAVTRFTRDTNVTIKLMNNNTSALSTTNVQTVAIITVPAGNTATELSTPIVFDITITPSDTYNLLVFSIDRDGQDFTELPRRWIPMQSFIVDSFGTISNIITDYLNPYIENMGRLKQIGIQSHPGLEMCINGEMIRVGRTGIYEINHGIDINFIGFMPEEDDHFIMDYQY